jgi:hypothetical protein
MDATNKPAKPADEKETKIVDDAPTVAAPGPAPAPAAAGVGVEGEIREFVRRDVTPARRLPHVDGDLGTTSISALMERVSGNSIKELDHLIAELTVVRDYLRSEGDRVQREITNYAQVSQAATASAKIILDSMGQWKTGSSTGPLRSSGNR